MIYVIHMLLGLNLIFQDIKSHQVHIIPFGFYILSLVFVHDLHDVDLTLFFIMSLLIVILKLYEFYKKKVYLGGADMILMMAMSFVFDDHIFFVMMIFSSFFTLCFMAIKKTTIIAFLPALIISTFGGLIYESIFR